MLAAVTPLPVIGVPVPLKHLDGMDSLLSIVQMPAGVPVATVAIGNARNAGLLAVRILAATDESLRDGDGRLPAALAESARAKGAAVRERRSDGMSDDRVPARSYLHIGLHKTGTTYLQNLWRANREGMRAQHIEFPGGPGEPVAGVRRLGPAGSAAARRRRQAHRRAVGRPRRARQPVRPARPR